MARFNKIYAGPVTEPTPQVQERICAAAILPGTALVESGANFAQAGANTGEKFYIAQDNYLALKGVDEAWPAGDTVIGMEALDEQFFNVRVPTGVNVARGAKLKSYHQLWPANYSGGPGWAGKFAIPTEPSTLKVRSILFRKVA